MSAELDRFTGLLAASDPNGRLIAETEITGAPSSAPIGGDRPAERSYLAVGPLDADHKLWHYLRGASEDVLARRAISMRSQSAPSALARPWSAAAAMRRRAVRSSGTLSRDMRASCCRFGA